MKALIMIDSFKGTITSKRLGEITQEEMSKKGIDSKYYPIADGGDGFLDAIEVFLKLKKVDIKCLDPLYREIDSYYLYDEDNKTAYIELAKASTSWIVYHTTYFNLLKHQILDYTTIEEVESVYYGTPLKKEYQQIIDTIINGGVTNETE